MSAVGFVIIAGSAGALGLVWSGATVDTVGKVTFDQPLAIPPLAESTMDAEGRRVFDLDLRAGTTDFGMGGDAETWGINGSYLGPTLRAERGEDVLVNVTNGLDETSTLHWHGMHLPAAMDGGPHQMIEPGATWSPSWQVDQPASTLWYHPHPHGATADHVYRGLAGMFILDDPSEAPPGLPSEYGVDDIPLVVQDKVFHDDGSLSTAEAFLANTGLLGDTILVNGTVGPVQEVTTTQVRFRLLNGSNARVYRFTFDDGREFAHIGSDGGLLPTPVPTTDVQLAPGERAEIVVSFAPGDDVVLRSEPPDLGAGPLPARFAGGDDRFDVLRLTAAEDLTRSPELPAELAVVDDVPAATTQRSFELGEDTINGRPMDVERIDAVIEKGTSEVWTVTNVEDVPHSFHVHDVHFWVLDIDGTAAPPELAGWKDTVYVRPDQTMRLAMSFDDYADPHLPYMFHCHMLRHEDRGMMGQFTVVDDPATAPTWIDAPDPSSTGEGADHHAGH